MAKPNLLAEYEAPDKPNLLAEYEEPEKPNLLAEYEEATVAAVEAKGSQGPALKIPTAIAKGIVNTVGGIAKVSEYVPILAGATALREKITGKKDKPISQSAFETADEMKVTWENVRQFPAATAEAAATAIAGVLRVARAGIGGRLGAVLSGGEETKPLADSMSEFSDTIRPAYNVTEAASQDLMGKLIDGAGSMASAVASGPAAPFVMGAMAGESKLQEARDRGASEKQQSIDFATNMVWGALSEQALGMPALLRSINRSGAGGEAYKALSKEITEQLVKGFAREGTQEVSQEMVADLSAKYISAWDPDREIIDENKLKETFLIGGILGSGMGATFQAAGSLDQKSKAREALKTVPTEVLRMGASDPEFRKTAPYDPTLIDEELVRRGTDAIQRTQKIRVEEPVETAEPEMVPVEQDPNAPQVPPAEEGAVSSSGEPIIIPTEEEAAPEVAPETPTQPTKTGPSDLHKAIANNRRAGTKVELVDGSTQVLNPLGGIDDMGVQVVDGFVDESIVTKVIDPFGKVVWERPAKTKSKPDSSEVDALVKDAMAGLEETSRKARGEIYGEKMGTGTVEPGQPSEPAPAPAIAERATQLAAANNTKYDGFDKTTGKHQFTILDKDKSTTFYIAESEITEEGLNKKIEFKRAQMNQPSIDTPEKLNAFLASLNVPQASAKTGAESAQPSIAEQAAPTGRVEALNRSLAEKQADLNAARALGDSDGEMTARAEIAVISKALKIAKMSDAEAAASTEARTAAKQELRARPKIKLKGKKKDAGGIPLNVIEEMFPTVIKVGRGIFEKTKDFARWTGEMVRAVGGAVRPYLKAIFDSISGANIRPQFRESGAVGGVGRRPTPNPGDPVPDARPGEYRTRTAQGDTGTLGQKAWEAIRSKTTVPDSFGEDIDFAYAKIAELGDLQAAYEYARSGGTPLDGMTERRQIATLFAVQSEASEARKAAEQAGNVAEMRRLAKLEEDAALAFGDLATQGGKNLNIIGQLYSAMPLTAEQRVRLDEKRLIKHTGGAAAHNASAEAMRRIKDAERKAAQEAAKEAAENAIRQSQSIPARERTAAVEALKKLINGKAPADAKPALQEYFDRVKADIRAALKAKNPKAAPPSDDALIAKSIAEMSENRYGEAADIWQRALGEMMDSMTPEKAQVLNQYLQEGIPDLFMRNAADAVAAEISRLSVEIADIAARSATDRNTFSQAFADEIVSRFPQLSVSQVERFRAAFKKAFDQRIEKYAKTELERMAKPSAPQGKRVQTISKLLRLYRLGALNDDTTARLFAEEAEAEEFTPEFRKKLLAMYEEAEKRPEGISRNEVMSEIAWEIAMANPKYNWWDYATAISYGNILGAASTILANNPIGALMSTLESVILMPLTNKGARWQSLKGAARTWATKLGEGITLANRALLAGENYQNVHQFDGALNHNPMEYLNRLADQPDTPTTKKLFARSGSQYRWISRMIMWPDALLRWPAKHALEFSLAAKMINERGIRGNRLWDAVDATLYPGGRQAAVAEAKQQVEEETRKGLLSNKAQKIIRQREIIESKMTGDAKEVISSSDELANYAGLLNDPAPDMLGQIHGMLIGLTSAPKPDPSLTGTAKTQAQAKYALAQALTPFLRFIRVAVNGTRLLLDYGVGLGAVRYAMRASPLIEGPAGIAQAEQRMMRGVIAVALYAGLSLYFASVDDDDDPWFDLIGTGPDDWRERKRLRDNKVLFNSIKTGNTYTRFSNSPIAAILGAFARYRDNKKWPKGEKTDAGTEEEPLMQAALSGIRDSLASMSFSRGIGDFISIINGKDNSFGQSPSQMLGNVAAAYIPGNFRGLSQFDEILSGPKERSDGFVGALSNGIAFYAPNGRGVTILGDEIPSMTGTVQRALEKTFNFSTLPDDKTLKFVLGTGIAIPTIGSVRDSKGRRLNHAQFSKYMQRSGARLRSVLERGGMEQLMKYPEQDERNGKTIHPRRDMLNKAWKEIRDEALNALDGEP